MHMLTYSFEDQLIKGAIIMVTPTYSESISDYDVVGAHAMALNCTVTFLSIHVAKTDFSETF